MHINYVTQLAQSFQYPLKRTMFFNSFKHFSTLLKEHDVFDFCICIANNY